jgi:hypothetical protein
MSGEESHPVDDNGADPDDVLWLAFANGNHNTVVRGPYTNKTAARESASEFNDSHVEPRVPRDDSDKSCIPGRD